MTLVEVVPRHILERHTWQVSRLLPGVYARGLLRGLRDALKVKLLEPVLTEHVVGYNRQ